MPDEQTPLMSHSNGDVSSSESTSLNTFRLAVGITNTNSPPSDLSALRKSSSGIYKSVITAQRRLRVQYHVIETVYWVAVLSQIVIGATLASLGPLAKLHPAAITILGIVNSCVAGLLALLKGQALPDRLRKDEFEMRKVQDYIEECECRLAVGWDEGDAKAVARLIESVFQRYDVARDTAEMNRPNSYAHQVEDGRPEGDSRRDGAPAAQNRIALGGKGKALQIS